MKFITIFVLLIVSVYSYSIDIKNFKSGLVCGINTKEMGWVCFESEEVLVSGQGLCISMGQELKCTWHGYSFDYSNAKKGQKIECQHATSKPMVTQDVFTRSEENKRVQNYTFTLNDEKGYFMNPQYSILNVSPNNKVSKITHDVECSSEGEVLFEYRLTTVYPPGVY